MKINAEFEKRVVVHSEEMAWVASPMAGVDRRALDRVGDEVARATTIVRYAPNSKFSSHVHTGGEEFVVLDGVFQDEHGDFPEGSYIRNPPQSSHTPRSDDGCTIFVKLWQFDLQDRTHVRLRTDHMAAIPHRDVPGVAVTPLYQDENENVSLQVWDANTNVRFSVPDGAEVLVLSGSLEESGDILKKNSWLRLPVGSELNTNVGKDGAKVWLKTGHLTQVSRDISNVSNR